MPSFSINLYKQSLVPRQQLYPVEPSPSHPPPLTPAAFKGLHILSLSDLGHSRKTKYIIPVFSCTLDPHCEHLLAISSWLLTSLKWNPVLPLSVEPISPAKRLSTLQNPNTVAQAPQALCSPSPHPPFHIHSLTQDCRTWWGSSTASIASPHALGLVLCRAHVGQRGRCTIWVNRGDHRASRDQCPISLRPKAHYFPDLHLAFSPGHPST